MIAFLYDFALLLGGLFLLPKCCFLYLVRRKYRQNLWIRFRTTPPISLKSRPVIWLHGVSMGEVKALSTLVPLIRESYPRASIVVSTVTETGREEAQKTVVDADALFYLPFDFSWIMRPFVGAVRPDLLLLVEGEYWLNLLCEVKRQGGKIAVVNGKLSQKSLKRYLVFPSLSRLCFSQIDRFYLKGQGHFDRFSQLGIDPERMALMDDLKFDIPAVALSDERCSALRERFGLAPRDRVLAIGSTHEGEELLLLRRLQPFFQGDLRLKILLVPRHPERFLLVARELRNAGYAYGSYSRPNREASVHLVDRMGILPFCYRLSDLALVGGSFIRGIGGHDIFEPVKMGIPVLFGPYMDRQVDLCRMVIGARAGRQLDVKALPAFIEEAFLDPHLLSEMGGRGKALAEKMMGSSRRLWREVMPLVRPSFTREGGVFPAI